jgi:hypothetical protein
MKKIDVTDLYSGENLVLFHYLEARNALLDALDKVEECDTSYIQGLSVNDNEPLIEDSLRVNLSAATWDLNRALGIITDKITGGKL